MRWLLLWAYANALVAIAGGLVDQLVPQPLRGQIQTDSVGFIIVGNIAYGMALFTAVLIWSFRR